MADELDAKPVLGRDIPALKPPARSRRLSVFEIARQVGATVVDPSSDGDRPDDDLALDPRRVALKLGAKDVPIDVFGTPVPRSFTADAPEGPGQDTPGRAPLPGSQPQPDTFATRVMSKARGVSAAPSRSVMGDLGRTAASLPRRLGVDPAIDALKGAISLPEMAVGAADIVTGGRVGRALENRGGVTGFDPEQAKAYLDDWYSPARKAGAAAVADADDVLTKTVAALSHPSVISGAVIESLPSVVAGGIVGRGLRAAGLSAELAGAGGEGITAGLAAAESIRQGSDDRLLTPGQTALAGTTALTTGALGVLGNNIAKWLKIADIDTALAAAAADPVAARGLAKSMVLGAVQEGLLEELPQSVAEQVQQNLALKRDPMFGVNDAAVLGALAGAVMGAGTQLLRFQPRSGDLAGGIPPTPAAPSPPAAPPPVSDKDQRLAAITALVRSNRGSGAYVEGTMAAARWTGTLDRARQAGASEDEIDAAIQMGRLRTDPGPQPLVPPDDPDGPQAPPPDEAGPQAPKGPQGPSAGPGGAPSPIEGGDPALGTPPTPRSLPPAGLTDEQRTQLEALGYDPDSLTLVDAQDILRSGVTPTPPPPPTPGPDAMSMESLSAAQRAAERDPGLRQRVAEMQGQDAAVKGAKMERPRGGADPITEGVSSDNTPPVEAAPTMASTPPIAKKPITIYRGQQPGQDGAWWTEDRGLAQAFAGMTRRGKSTVGEVREDTLQPDDITTIPYLVTGYATPTEISKALGIPVQVTSLDLAPDVEVRVHAYLEEPDVRAALREAGVKVVGAWERADKGRDVRVFMRVLGPKSTPQVTEPPAGTKYGLPSFVTGGVVPQKKGRPTAKTEAMTGPMAVRVEGAQKLRPIKTFEEAGQIADQMFEALGVAGGPGGWTFPKIEVVDPSLKVIARVSQNGRIWDATTGQEIERNDGRGDGKTKPIDVAPSAASDEYPNGTPVETSSGLGTVIAASNERTSRLVEFHTRKHADGTTSQEHWRTWVDVTGLSTPAVADPTAGDTSADDDADTAEIAAEVRRRLESRRQLEAVVEAPPSEPRSNAATIDDARRSIRDGAVVSDEDAAILRDLAQSEADQNAAALEGQADGPLSWTSVDDYQVPIETKGAVRHDAMRAAVAGPFAVHPTPNQQGWTLAQRSTGRELFQGFESEAMAKAAAKLLATDREYRGIDWSTAESFTASVTLPQRQSLSRLRKNIMADRDERDALARAAMAKPATLEAESPAKAAPPETTKTETAERPFSMRKSSSGRVEIRFKDKPPEQIRDALKARKFRWTKAGGGHWYSTDANAEVEGTRVLDAFRKSIELATTGSDQGGEAETSVKWTKAKIVPTREGVKTEVVEQTEQAAPPTFKVGDRVKGWEGTGTIIDVLGDKAQMRLDDTQRSSKWHNMAGLTAAPDLPTKTESQKKPVTPQVTDAPEGTRYVLPSFVTGGVVPRDAKADKLAEIRRKLGQNKAEVDSALAGIKAELKKAGNTLSSGLPVPSDALIMQTVRLVKAYSRAGVLEAEIGWILFQEQLGDLAEQAREAFREAWAIVYKTDAPSLEAADERRGGDADGGQLAAGGRGATESAGASGEGPLGALPAHAREGAVDDAEGAGDRGAKGDPSVAVSGRPGGSADRDAPGRAGARDARPAIPAAGAGTGAVDPGPVPADYQLTPERLAAITDRTSLERAKGNVAAIELVQTLRAEGRHATADEQDVLAKYVGWGDRELARLLDRSDYGLKGSWKDLHQKLKNLTTEDERAAMAHSSLNAHYTYGIYKPLWEALERAGFTQGRILEPAVGTGHAFGAMPARMREASTLRAVELEPFTAAIAQALYPSARVQAAGFEKAALATGSIDLAISNVPFGRYPVVDITRPAFITDYIHNYFFDKALDHVRPGGLVVFVTSKGTLDQSGGTLFRRHLMSRAHFLGAVRLPGGDSGAFVEGAKTEVVTDLVVLQRKLNDTDTHPNDDLFVNVDTVKLPTSSGASLISVARSSWYTAHPNLVLGREAMSGTMNRRDGYNVEATGELSEQLSAALAEVLPPGTYAPRAQQEAAKPRAVADDGARVGAFVVKDGAVYRVDANRELEPLTLATKAAARVVGMVGIRDTLRELRDTMRDPDATDAAIKQGQRQLRKRYDAFVKAHGLLNLKVNADLFASDPEAPNILGLEGIEPKVVTEKGKDGKPRVIVKRVIKGLSAIFEKRVIGPRAKTLTAKTAKDALLMSLAGATRIDWPFMEAISGRAASDLQAELMAAGLVYEQPTGTWVPADEYLSGDVVTKLADARAEGGPRMARNIAALEAIQPAPKKPGEVPIALGAAFVPPNVFMDFMRDVLGLSGKLADGEPVIVGTSQAQQWGLPKFSPDAERVARTHALSVEYGPPAKEGQADDRYPFGKGWTYTVLNLFADAMNLKQPRATYTWKDEKGSTHTEEVAEATAALRANLDALQGEFDTWLVANPDTHQALTDIYNVRYNREVPRVFDGSHMRDVLRQNGMSLPFELHPHQLNAIWRVLATGNTLLGHEVGAGKTFEMIGIAMEMRRTGRASKPMITVPTHILDDVKKAVIEMYPDAKLLAFEANDLNGKARQAAMARIANGDWDIVLVPHSSFTLLSSSPKARNTLLNEWIRDAEDAYEAEYARNNGDESRPGVKAAQRVLARIKAALEKRLEDTTKRADTNLYWEDLGVDALIVDEAHYFKNLFFVMNMDHVKGVSQSTAMKSLDVMVKIRAINQASNYRNLVFATATPLMNSMVEAFTMQRYLQPQAMEAAGVASFENWYRMFGKAGMVLEPLPDGTYREVLRVKEFKNLDTLSKMFRRVMDYVGWDDMPYLKLPKAVYHTVETPKHPMYDSHLLPWFAKRIAVLREQPSVVNQIKKTHTAPYRSHPITGTPLSVPDLLIQVMEDAKQASIDARLVLGSAAKDFRQSRIQIAADRMVAAYKAHNAEKGVQLAFMDKGIPQKPGTLPFLSHASVEGDDALDAALGDDSDPDEQTIGEYDYANGFNLYDALRDALIERGIPAREIAYLHQANTGAERRALFDAANEGRVRFVFASTDKGGVGMNIQRRLSDLHMIDAPRFLRPGDEQQRLGRGIRQGNMFETVNIHRYVTKGTADEWLLQVLGIKRDITLSFLKGVAIEFQEPDASSLSLDEAMARASGDARAIERVELKAAYQRVKAQALAQRRAIANAVGRIPSLTAYVKDLGERLDRLERFLRDDFRDLKGDRFEITVEGTTHTDRKSATDAMVAAFDRFAGDAAVRYTSDPEKRMAPLGTIGGLPLRLRVVPAATWSNDPPTARIELDATGVGGDIMRVVEAFAVEGTVSDYNLAMSAQNRYGDVAAQAPELARQLENARTELQRAEELVANPPAVIATAERMAVRIATLDKELAADSEAKAKALKAQAQAYLKAGGVLVRPLKSALPKPKPATTTPGGTAGRASEGEYMQPRDITTAALDTRRQHVTGLTTVKKVELPELVAFVDELTGRVPKVVAQFRKATVRGMFRAGSVMIRADLFKPEHRAQLVATLAHEIGHLADWLDDLDDTRGNILGHLQALHKFLKHSYTSPDGEKVKRDVIRTELRDLSAKWRPWDRDTAEAREIRYRDSAHELYADAISVLLNDPAMLQTEAPTFFKEFFEQLEQRPDTKRAFLELWEAVSGTADELAARRQARLDAMLDAGDAKAIDVAVLRRQEAALARSNLVKRLRIEYVDKNTAIIDAAKAYAKEHGAIPVDDDPRYLLEEREHVGAIAKAWVETHVQPVMDALQAAGVEWRDFAHHLFFERVANGDRDKIANPQGITPEVATDLRQRLRDRLTSAQRTVIDTALADFRAAVKQVAEDAYKAGLYTDEQIETVRENDYYATFRVIEHMDEVLTSALHQQLGTFKDIQNAADATMLKTIVTIKAARHNEIKAKAFAWMLKHMPDAVQAAPMKWDANRKTRVPAEPTDKRLTLVTWKVKGKVVGAWVDPFVAKAFTQTSVGYQNGLLQALQWTNGHLFRPVFTTYNLGFMAFNFGRDFLRFWKATPTMTLRRAVQRYVQAVPMAAARARRFGYQDGRPLTAKQLKAKLDVIAAEKAAILDVTFADMMGMDSVQDNALEQLLAETGIRAGRQQARGRVRRTLDWIRDMGDFIETLPKAAAIIELTSDGRTIEQLNAAERSFIRRKVGSPDFKQKGASGAWFNNVFLYGNAITQGVRADLETATEPTTRGGYWAKTVAVTVLPKLAMAAAIGYALRGGADDDDEVATVGRILAGVSEYDLANYLIIPLWLTETGKSVYIRLPQDDFGRLMGGLTWKALHLGQSDYETAAALSGIFDYTAGQGPSLSPIFGAGVDAVQMISGRNLYDSFRGRLVFDETEMAASSRHRWQKFAGYEFQQMGGSVFYRQKYRQPGATRSALEVILDLPMMDWLGPGRFLKVSDQGHAERLRRAAEPVRRGAADRALEERTGVGEALSTLKGLPLQDRTDRRVADEAAALAERIYSAQGPDAVKRQTADILRKLRMGLVRGTVDPYVDQLVSQRPLDEKVAIVVQARKEMSAQQFARWLTTAEREGIITKALLKRLDEKGVR